MLYCEKTPLSASPLRFTLISPESRQDSGKIRLEMSFTSTGCKVTDMPGVDLARNIYPVRLTRK